MNIFPIFLLISNLFTLETKITQDFPKVYYNLPTKNLEIALTFDDGPFFINTPNVLDILKKEGVKATFFLLGENMTKKNIPIIKRIVQEGHEIGLHSYSHPNFNKLTKTQITEEIDRNISLLKSILGFAPHIIRPPYGIVNKKFLEVAKEKKLRVICWSNDTLDWKKDSDYKDIVENATASIHPGAIILMHDKSNNYSQSRIALPKIIKKIRIENYTFLTVSNFFDL